MQRYFDERDGVVTQLAALLCQAARLASQVNSDGYSDEQRTLLLDLVGRRDYHELAENLCQLRHPLAREKTRRSGYPRGRG